jgi:eukaryotic-like serine/threonine-protein kinase
MTRPPLDPDDRDGRGGDSSTETSPVEALLTPPDRPSGPGEPTQGMPVGLTTLASGRYALGRQLGAGGMGLVRAAHDEVLHREVAVKLLADNLAADPEARERFLREARAAARIHDAHVVTVYDVGDEAGRPYLVMELVDGPSLADVLATEGRLDPHEVVEVAAQALAGIARAHEADLLHRDVKPGNLLRHPDGTIKVTDFGVAEAADAPGLTRTGFVIGTRSYLAPERRRGRPADRRTDLYALGATLAELLNGRPPAVDEDLTLPDDTPGGLARLVRRLLAPEPDDRPADAETALEVLAGGGRDTAEEATLAIDDGSAIDTVALAAGATDPRPRRSADLSPGEADGRTEVLPVDRAAADAPDSHGSSTPVMPWRTVVIVAVALLAVAIILQLATGGDQPSDDAPTADEPVDAGDDASDDASDGGEEGDEGGTPDGGVERVEDDPEATARNLAEWLRGRAENG